MKKIYLSVATAIIAVSLLGGCAASTPDDSASTSGNGSAATDKPNDSQSSNVTGAENTNAEIAEQKILYGEVSDIAGNAIMVKVIEMPEGRIFSGEGGNFSGNFGGMEIEFDEEGNPIISDEMRQQMEERMAEAGIDGQAQFTRPEGGNNSGGNDGEVQFTMPEGGEGNAAEGRTRMSPGNRTAQMERAYTGEEVDIIIPVGLPLITMSFGENGVEETEIKLEKLKSGDIITVTYAADGVSIEKIVVSQNGVMGSMSIPIGGEGMPEGGFIIQGGGNGPNITITPGGGGR